MRNYPQVRRALAGKLWYVHEQKMQEMLAFLEIKLAGGSAAPEVLESIRAANAEAATRAKGAAKSGSVAVIPIYGMIMHRQMTDISGGSSGTSCNMLSAAIQQAVADPNVSQIVLDIDSPGGDVDGVDELASEIYQARKQKKITAVSNCLCASAAYYLAAQASEIVVSPSSLTGSIGVYTMHEDDSAMLESMGVKLTLVKFGENKAEGNSLGPLTDTALAHMQEMVDSYGVAFEKAVARGRKITQDEVHNKFGQGRVFDAKTAVKLGMADRVGTLNDVLGQAVGGSGSGMRAAEEMFSVAARLVGPVESASFSQEEIAIPPQAKTKAADDCTCDCTQCDADDCKGCTHLECDCAGCTCPAATTARSRASAFARIRHQLAVAGL